MLGYGLGIWDLMVSLKNIFFGSKSSMRGELSEFPCLIWNNGLILSFLQSPYWINLCFNIFELIPFRARKLRRRRVLLLRREALGLNPKPFIPIFSIFICLVRAFRFFVHILALFLRLCLPSRLHVIGYIQPGFLLALLWLLNGDPHRVRRRYGPLHYLWSKTWVRRV